MVVCGAKNLHGLNLKGAKPCSPFCRQRLPTRIELVRAIGIKGFGQSTHHRDGSGCPLHHERATLNRLNTNHLSAIFILCFSIIPHICLYASILNLLFCGWPAGCHPSLWTWYLVSNAVLNPNCIAYNFCEAPVYHRQ